MANLLPIDFSQISTYITLAVILMLSVVLLYARIQAYECRACKMAVRL